MSKNLPRGHHYEFNVKKMKYLRDMNFFSRKMTSGFMIEVDLQRSIDRITETMEVWIDIYDRIDSYSDSANLAKYISDIVSATFVGIQVDAIFQNPIENLQRLIKSNLVLEPWLTLRKNQSWPVA